MLLKEGCEIAVCDPNVSIPRLIGANKGYIERQIPDLALLMRNSAQEVLDHAEVILIGHDAESFRDALATVRPDQMVFDLVRITGHSKIPHDSYQGLCW